MNTKAKNFYRSSIFLSSFPLSFFIHLFSIETDTESITTENGNQRWRQNCMKNGYINERSPRDNESSSGDEMNFASNLGRTDTRTDACTDFCADACADVCADVWADARAVA